MADTLWSDISEFQVPANDQYPYNFITIRSNDGNYQDKHFVANHAWCDSALSRGKLWGYMVYYFYRPYADGAAMLMKRVGTPNPRLTVMIDVEGAGGQIRGDQSAAINAQYTELAHWLGDPRRVVGYGNPGDLNSLWPSKPAGLRLVVAAYGSNPGYPGRFAHQFSSTQPTAPFGPSDINSADGMSPADLQAMFGFGHPAPAPAPPPPHTAPAARPAPTHAPPASAQAYVPPLHVDYFSVSHNARCLDVRVWQAQMHSRGWKLAVDGDFGSQSETVCKQFQAEKALKQDGEVGPQTWGATWTAPVTR